MQKEIVFYFSKINFNGAYKSTLSLMQRHPFKIIYIHDSDIRCIEELKKYTEVEQIYSNYHCDIVINCTSDKIHPIVKAKRYISWVHSYRDTSKLYKERVVVSKTVQNDIGGTLIYNELDKNIPTLAEEYIVPHTDKLKLVSVSRLTAEKGLEDLPLPNVPYTLYIIGGGNPVYTEILKNKYKDNSNIIFTGELENPYPYMKWADYLLVFSKRDTWNLTITEASSLGTPIICGDLPVFKEQVIDGVNGYFYTPEVWSKKIPKFKPNIRSDYKKWFTLLK